MSTSNEASTWLSRQWRLARGRLRTSWQPHQLYLFDRAASLTSVDAAVAAFGQWCEAHPGEVCSVGLSGRWLLSSVSQIDVDHDAAHGHAVQQWSHYLDIDEAALAADWVLRQLALPNVSLLCAAPRALIDGLREQAAAHGVRLEWIGPWWTRGVQAWLASLNDDEGAASAQPAFMLYEPGLLTHARAHLDDGRGAWLSEVWTEVASEAMPALTDKGGLCLTPPPADALAGAPYERHIWAHAAVAGALQGRLASPEVAA
ncbi:MAG: hypothetical protein QM749_10635 [Aquabacterium sp.]